MNECELDFMDCSIAEKREYFHILYRTVACEPLEHDDNSGFTIEQLGVLLILIYKDMRQKLQCVGRREITYALKC